MVESGFDQFIMTSISAIVAPAGTPLEIRRRLNEVVTRVLGSACKCHEESGALKVACD